MPPVIDHDPEEPPPDRSKSPWGVCLVIFGAAWAAQIYLGKVDWISALGGVATGGILTAWAIEATGNRIPTSWRGKPPRR